LLELEDARAKEEALSEVMARAGKLRDVLGRAAEVADKKKNDSDPRSWVRECRLGELEEKGASLVDAMLSAGAGAKMTEKKKEGSGAGAGGAGDVFATMLSSDEGKAEEQDTPAQLIQRILTKPCGSLETVVLRTFTYFMKPVQLWEQINITYCAGPSVVHAPGQAADIEKVISVILWRNSSHPFSFFSNR
jgi:hypothetical protein